MMLEQFMQSRSFLIVLRVVIFLTVVWQIYYCQLRVSLALHKQKQILLIELGKVALLLVLVWLPHTFLSNVLAVLVLLFIWWHIWQNYRSFHKKIYEDINYHTYKQAWDSLPVPVAIANADHQIILANQGMHDFLAQHLHLKVRSMQALWQSLAESKPGSFTVSREEGQLILHLANKDVYWVELESFTWQKQHYEQLTLTPLTNQEEILRKERIANLLDEDKQGLVQLLRSLEEVKRHEVAEELHGRVHDFMGQRMAVLERFLSQDVTDYARLLPLLENVLQDMRQTEVQSCALQLQNILDSCASLGLNVSIEGILPARQDWAQCFVNMLREGVTNAVRHGNATEIAITLTQEDDFASIVITSNGKVPKEIKKGKGLTGMEKALQALGGSLKFSLTDKFVLLGEVGARRI